MTWILLGIFTAINYGLYNFFLKLSSNNLNPGVALMLVDGTAFLIALIFTIYLKLTGEQIVFSNETIKIPILAGIFVGIAGISYIFMFSKGAPLNIGITFVTGLTIISGIILSFIFLKEPLSLVKILGISFIIIGIILLSKS